MIDGCTRFQSFTHVILPLAKAGHYDTGDLRWNHYLE